MKESNIFCFLTDLILQMVFQILDVKPYLSQNIIGENTLRIPKSKQKKTGFCTGK